MAEFLSLRSTASGHMRVFDSDNTLLKWRNIQNYINIISFNHLISFRNVLFHFVLYKRCRARLSFEPSYYRDLVQSDWLADGKLAIINRSDELISNYICREKYLVLQYFV